MGAESNIRSRINKLLREHGFDTMAVENSACPGTPDVNYANARFEGWVELKQIAEWPRRSEATVKVAHFRPEQRIWLRNRCKRGGLAYLLMRVDTDWILFWGSVAADYLGHHPKAFLIENAMGWWPSGLNEEGLVRCLTTRQQS